MDSAPPPRDWVLGEATWLWLRDQVLAPVTRLVDGADADVFSSMRGEGSFPGATCLVEEAFDDERAAPFVVATVRSAMSSNPSISVHAALCGAALQPAIRAAMAAGKTALASKLEDVWWLPSDGPWPGWTHEWECDFDRHGRCTYDGECKHNLFGWVDVDEPGGLRWALGNMFCDDDEATEVLRYAIEHDKGRSVAFLLAQVPAASLCEIASRALDQQKHKSFLAVARRLGAAVMAEQGLIDFALGALDADVVEWAWKSNASVGGAPEDALATVLRTNLGFRDVVPRLVETCGAELTTDVAVVTAGERYRDTDALGVVRWLATEREVPLTAAVVNAALSVVAKSGGATDAIEWLLGEAGCPTDDQTARLIMQTAEIGLINLHFGDDAPFPADCLHHLVVLEDTGVLEMAVERGCALTRLVVQTAASCPRWTNLVAWAVRRGCPWRWCDVRADAIATRAWLSAHEAEFPPESDAPTEPLVPADAGARVGAAAGT